MPMFNGQQMPQMPWQNAAIGGGAMSPQFGPRLPWQQPGQNPMPWTQAQPLGQQGGGMAGPQGGMYGAQGGNQRFNRPGGPRDQWYAQQNPQGGGAGPDFFNHGQFGIAAGQAGTFDPFGSPQLLEMIRQAGLGDLGARLNSNRLNVQLHGNDPYLQAYGSLMGNMQGESDISRSLQEAQLQQMLQSQDFWQRIFSQQLGIGAQQESDKYTRDAAAKARKQGGRNAALGVGGQIIGAGLGAIGGKK